METGSEDSARSEGSVNFGIVRNYAECVEVCEVVQRVGNRVAEYGFEYFCLDYVSKIGVNVTECNIWKECRQVSGFGVVSSEK